MHRYIVSFWSPRGDYTGPDIVAPSPGAAVNKAWPKVPKKYREGMVRGFVTDLDSDDMDDPFQFEWVRSRWKEIQ
jgi:hypothetical protein